jgi:hypothetical protein
MAKHSDDETKPGPREVLATSGEDSAAGYAAGEVPEAPEATTIDLDRVRIVPPSQTPTVKLVELAKRRGPRAPDQMKLREATGPVELPEGRPLTATQSVNVDPDFLLELAKARAEREAAGKEERRDGEVEAVKENGPALKRPEREAQPKESPWVKEAPPIVNAAALPSAGAPPSAPVSTAGEGAEKKPARGRVVLTGVTIGLTMAVAVIAALRPGSGGTVNTTPTASASPSTAAAPSPSTAAPSTTTVAPSTTTTEAGPGVPPTPPPNATMSASPRTTATPSVSPGLNRAPGKAVSPVDETYDAAVPKPSTPAAAPPAPGPTLPAPSPSPAVANLPGGDKTEF